MSHLSSSALVSTNERRVWDHVVRCGPMRGECVRRWWGGEDWWLTCHTVTPHITLHTYYVLFTANNLLQSLGILQYFDKNTKILPIWFIWFSSVIESSSVCLRPLVFAVQVGGSFPGRFCQEKIVIMYVIIIIFFILVNSRLNECEWWMAIVDKSWCWN